MTARCRNILELDMNLIATSVTKTALTEALESQLGDPKNPGNPLSFAYSQKIDETEQFPEEAIRWLYDRQLARHYVPEELGGSFRSFAALGGGGCGLWGGALVRRGRRV